MNDIQLALARKAKQLGKRTDELTSLEVTGVSIASRGPLEVIGCGAKALASVAVTSLGFRRVPLPIFEQRKALCEDCKFHGHTIDGAIYCGYCGCAGVLMNAALHDAAEACRLPAGQRRWEAHVEP